MIHNALNQILKTAKAVKEIKMDHQKLWNGKMRSDFLNLIKMFFI